MSVFVRLEKLFEGWFSSLKSVPGGIRVTVPRMSEGAMRVMETDIQTQFPEVCRVEISPTPQGGYTFDLRLNSSGNDGVTQLLLAVQSLDLAELSSLLEPLRTVKEASSRSVALAELALALEERKEFDLARRAYTLSLGFDPTQVRVRFNFATMCLKLGDLEGAINDYEMILEQDATFEPALHNLAAYHAQRGDRNRAQSFLTRLLEAHPNSATAQLLAGQMAQQEGRLAPALEHYLRAVLVDPEDPEAHYRAAVLFRELEMEKEAVDYWNRYSALAGTIPEGRYLSARILVQGNPEGAAVIIDGIPVGAAPKALMDLPAGRHQIGIRSLLAELSCDIEVQKAKSYLVRYDLATSRLTYEPTVPNIRVMDESGQEVSGSDLGRRILEHIHHPPDTLGPSARDVFACVLFECLKDRQLGDAERELIFGVKQLLRISSDVHQQVFREVEQKLKSSAPSRLEAEPEEIYRLLARRALEDGHLLTQEHELLTHIGRLLSIPRSRRAEIEGEIQASFGSRAN